MLERQLATYIAMDRREALSAGRSLPDRATGSLLFADIAGFTPLTEALARNLGPRRGAEELTGLLNAVYDSLVSRVHHFTGSVISFVGDALVAWFHEDEGLHALACALQMQRVMKQFGAISLPEGGRVSLSMKTAVAVGPVRRLLVGDRDIQRLDVLAGSTLDRVAQVEHAAHRGEVVASSEVIRRWKREVILREWRGDCGVVDGLATHTSPRPWPESPDWHLTRECLRPFLLAPVYDRVVSGQGEFLAELRQTVVLFLRFDGLEYDRDDEVGDKLDAFSSWVQGVVNRYGGHVLLLTTGDKGSHLYAVFGALGAHEDDSERAVASALELRNPPADLGFIGGIRTGISQGRARVGAYGGTTRRTYGALGDAVNLAARLMEKAPAGEIRCSHAICESASRRWSFETLPAVRLKGIQEPQPLYRPLGRVRDDGPHITGTLIGRKKEMRSIANALKDAQAGARRVVLIEGEAGMGKSRLVEELMRMTRESPMLTVVGTGDSVEQHKPYRAWRDIMLAFFGLTQQPDTEECRRFTRAKIAALDPAYESRVPLLNDILNLEFAETDATRSLEPELRKRSLEGLVVELFQSRTTGEPLVLVIEDAHWLDSLSWELTAYVLRALAGHPILLAITFRPMEEGICPELGVLLNLEGADLLRLRSLPAEEAAALAAATLGLPADALPTELVELIQDRAEGNPFFAIELIRALHEDGSIVVEGDTCAIRGDLSVLRENTPETLEGVVLSRLDRLSVEEQLTLRVAAVIGRSFPLRLLHSVYPTGITESTLRTHLAEMTRRGLTVQESQDPNPSYTFQHFVTQQVTYGTLLFGQRRALHRQVATWYEETYVDNLSPFYQLLVFHWGQAQHPERELEYCQLAGQQAASRYANTEAVKYLSRALELNPARSVDRGLELLFAREEVYDLQGAREDQKQDLDRLAELAVGEQSSGSAAKVALRQAHYAEVTGDYQAAIEQAQNAIHLARTYGDSRVEAAASHQLGRAFQHQGSYETAGEHLERAISVARVARLEDIEADGLRSLGIVTTLRGDKEAANSYFEDALAIYQHIGDRHGEGNTMHNLGTVLGDLGNYPEARRRLENALRVRKEIGDRWGNGWTLDALGQLALLEGKYPVALEHFRQALEIFREVGERRGEGVMLGSFGDIALAQGVFDESKSAYEESVRIFREIGDRQFLGWQIGNLGVLHDRLGAYSEARGYHETSLNILREIGDRQGEGWELANLCLLHYHLDDDDTAREVGLEACSIATELDDRFNLSGALTRLGHVLTRAGDFPEAESAYEKALTLRRELGEERLVIETMAGLARLRMTIGDRKAAWKLTEEIAAFAENNILDGTDEPARVLLTCYRGLEDESRAWRVLEKAHDLLQGRARRLGNSSARETYLWGVAVHREILTTYEAAHQTGG